MRKVLFGVGSALFAMACDGDLVSRAPLPVEGPNVSITATVRGHADSFDSVAVRIVNHGFETAYLNRCGLEPFVVVQHFVNGDWTGGVPSILCVTSPEPGPVRVAPGDSIQIFRFLQPSHIRMTIDVSGSADLANPTTAISNVLDVP